MYTCARGIYKGTRCLGKAFTLIELLIVVAIIGILAAIAVPNFLNAQIRAKVARVKGDLRAIGTALDSYRVDNNTYPLGPGPDLVQDLRGLTTPITYIAQVSMLAQIRH